MVDLCGCVWTIFVAIGQITDGPTPQDEALRLVRSNPSSQVIDIRTLRRTKP